MGDFTHEFLFYLITLKTFVMKNYLKLSALTLTLFVFIFTNCKKTDDDANTVFPEEETNEITNFIVGIADLPDPVSAKIITVQDSSVHLSDCEYWKCIEKEIDWSIAPQEFPTHDVISPIIYPGNPIKGNSISKATPERALIKRGGGNLTITTLNGTPLSTEYVEELASGNVYQTINNLIAANPGEIAGSWAYTMTHLEHKEQLQIALEAKASFLDLAEISGKLSFDESKEYNRFLVKLTQRLYTVIADPVYDVVDFFHDDVTIQDLEKVSGPNNPLCYLSSVAYGREFYLLIESTSEKSEMEAKINASFLKVYEGEVNHSSLEALSDLRITAAAIGGVSTNLIGAVAGGDLSKLNEIIGETGTITTAEPTSYTIRSVATDKVVKNGVATVYTLTNCYPLGEQVIKCENGELNADCSCNCDCPYTGNLCEKLKSVKRKDTRMIKVGTAPQASLERYVQASGSKHVMVGFGIGVTSSNVNKITIKVRELLEDGALGSISTLTDGSGTLEAEYQVPSSAVITGIKLGTSNSDINAFEVRYRDVALDQNSCELKFVGPTQTYHTGSTAYEVQFKVEDESYTNFPCFQGVGAEVSDNNFRALAIRFSGYAIE